MTNYWEYNPEPGGKRGRPSIFLLGNRVRVVGRAPGGSNFNSSLAIYLSCWDSGLPAYVILEKRNEKRLKMLAGKKALGTSRWAVNQGEDHSKIPASRLANRQELLTTELVLSKTFRSQQP